MIRATLSRRCFSHSQPGNRTQNSMTALDRGTAHPQQFGARRRSAIDARGTRPNANGSGRKALYCRGGLNNRALRVGLSSRLGFRKGGNASTRNRSGRCCIHAVGSPGLCWHSTERAPLLFERQKGTTGPAYRFAVGCTSRESPPAMVFVRGDSASATSSGRGFCDTGLRNSLLQFLPNAANLNEDERSHRANQAA